MRFLFWSLLLFCMWLILTSSLALANIFVGLLVSSAISILYIKLFKAEASIHFSPLWMLIYLYVLLKNLIKSNISIAKRILSPDMHLSPAIIAVETSLEEDWKRLLLANSITLTPGTLSLDIKENKIFIHIIEYDEGIDKKSIIEEFEQVIAKI